MVWSGCVLIIHPFNLILSFLFFFSLFCFLDSLFCKCLGAGKTTTLLWWLPWGCAGRGPPWAVLTPELLDLPHGRGAGAEAGATFTVVCRTCLLVPAHSNFPGWLLKRTVRAKKHLEIVHQGGGKRQKKPWIETLLPNSGLYVCSEMPLHDASENWNVVK